jgi:hypothetical protein
MPQPKTSTIVLILAVFACVMLYVLGMGLGAQDTSARKDEVRIPVSKEERERLRERFVKPRPVTAEDLHPTRCTLSEDTVRVRVGSDPPCEVVIAESGTRVRTVNVEPLAGSQVNVTLTPKGGPAVVATVEKLGKRRGFDVPGEGATLTLTCTQPVGNTFECPVKLR